MAAGLGFKDFTTGEVLTAADVDGYLMQGVWVFADAAARSAAVTSPQEGNYSFLKDTNSTEYYDGSSWVATGGGGGKVLQVVSTTYSTATTIASTSLTDTGLTLSITPSSDTSKILVCITQAYRVEATTADTGFSMIVDRSGTTVFDMNQNGYNTAYLEASGATAITKMGYFAMQYLDSPATTSSRTYKTQARVYATDSSRKVIMNNNSSPASIILMEIGA